MGEAHLAKTVGSVGQVFDGEGQTVFNCLWQPYAWYIMDNKSVRQ